MNRRNFLRTIGFGAAAVSLPTVLQAKERVPKRPNILFIMSDDHAAQAIGCYGSKINKTPNIDRIAAQGMRFDNCFCTNSICTPSRAGILTGKYSHKTGCLAFETFDGSQQTFPKLLQKAGYYTAMVGKWHLSVASSNVSATAEQQVRKNPPTGFDYWNILPGQGEYFDPVTIEMGKATKHKGYVTDTITDIALEALEKRPKDKPFCLMYHHKAVHDTWEYDDKHAHLYKDADVPEPETFNDDYSNRGRAIKRVTQKIGKRQTLYEKETGHLPPEKRKKQQYQVFIKKYLRCVASLDDNIGRVLDYLDKAGLTEDTIVVYTSDQGFFLGEHGMFDKRFMYEESLRMPLVVRYPKEIKPGSANDDIVLNVDFAETFLDYAGAAIPKDMQGRSLRPLLNGKTPSDWRRSMYYRYWLHLAHFGVAAHYGVRMKRYKLIYYYGMALGVKDAIDVPTEPEWELFDLNKDPREMNNVHDDLAYAKVAARLRVELFALRKQLDDTDSRYPEMRKLEDEYIEPDSDIWDKADSKWDTGTFKKQDKIRDD
jgi:arylsulfatase A-like enzyme